MHDMRRDAKAHDKIEAHDSNVLVDSQVIRTISQWIARVMLWERNIGDKGLPLKPTRSLSRETIGLCL